MRWCLIWLLLEGVDLRGWHALGLRSPHGCGLVGDLLAWLHLSVAGLSAHRHWLLHVDDLLLMTMVRVDVVMVLVIMMIIMMAAMVVSPPACPHDAHDDENGAAKWKQNVKEDNGDHGLTTVVVVVVVVAECVSHLCVETLFLFFLLEGGRDGCGQAQRDHARFVERF